MVTEADVRERLVQVLLDSAVGENGTRDMLIASPTFYVRNFMSIYEHNIVQY